MFLNEFELILCFCVDVTWPMAIAYCFYSNSNSQAMTFARASFVSIVESDTHIHRGRRFPHSSTTANSPVRHHRSIFRWPNHFWNNVVRPARRNHDHHPPIYAYFISNCSRSIILVECSHNSHTSSIGSFFFTLFLAYEINFYRTVVIHSRCIIFVLFCFKAETKIFVQ